MLNSDYIHLKIKAPETCSSEDAGNFKELIELFPYASTFSILYLNSLSNSSDIRLENELEKLAFRIIDRSVLYKLLNSQPSQVISSENKAVETSHIEKIVETKVITHKNQEQEENQLKLEIEEPDISQKIQDLDNADLELNKLINSAAYASTFIEKELDAIHEINQEVEIIEEIEKEVKIVNSSEAIPDEENPIANSSTKSFTDWLKLSSISQDEEMEFRDEKIRTPEYYTFEKPKKEFFSPSKKAKESLDENKMPVSETLAKIFALQGNFSKSIYVYEQLILIFPEKKTFFATQIKNLKKKINL